MRRSPGTIDKHVGARVRMRRMMLGWSQMKLGDALGIAFQQVHKYEKGVNRIGAGRLQDIARLLGAPIGFFYDGAPGAATARAVAGGDLVNAFFTLPHAAELAEHFMAIDNIINRRLVVDLARVIANKTMARAAKAKAA
jgi:transcriptional regulator with XRE-family HTH domain